MDFHAIWISNSVIRDICIFFPPIINYLFIIKKIYLSLLNPPINYKLSIEILAIFICRMERVQNGCQSCNAFNKTIKSWQRGDSRGAITTQSAAKIVQLKVYSVQASLTLRDRRRNFQQRDYLVITFTCSQLENCRWR